MSVKTLKQMALELLALDKLTDSEAAWLNHATREQAYPGLKERWEATGTTTPILVTDYVNSFDDCLMLPDPPDSWIHLQFNMSVIGCSVMRIHDIETRNKDEVVAWWDYPRANADVSRIWLKAWWTAQPD